MEGGPGECPGSQVQHTSVTSKHHSKTILSYINAVLTPCVNLLYTLL
jgi:hypothetical protein